MNFNSEKIYESILEIQKKWGDGIIEIGRFHKENKCVNEISKTFIEELYFFQDCKVLFKPTKASKLQFRKSKDEFLSYFVGKNKVSDEDIGCALEPWKEITFKNFDYIFTNDLILSMGNYYFKNYKDEVFKVEYTFVYKYDSKKILKILLHHSSLPYNN